MRKVKLLVALVGTLAVSSLVATALYATAEFGKTTGKPCTHCHVKAGSKDLNDIGKCFQTKKSLDTCK